MGPRPPSQQPQAKPQQPPAPPQPKGSNDKR
jgi:hypothetical protein